MLRVTNIFKAFHRLGNAVTKDGFGLGLSIVESIIKLMEGKVGSPDNVRGKRYPNISTKHDRFPEKMFTFAV